MVGSSAATGLAHLHPELALLRAAGVRSAVPDPGVGCYPLGGGMLQARIAAPGIAVVHGVAKIRCSGGSQAWPGCFHTVFTRLPHVLHSAPRAW